MSDQENTPAASSRSRPLTHGARSEAQIRDTARAHKRRVLRQLGLRAGDLEGIGLAHLDAWARAHAKVTLMDAWGAEHGWLDDHGNPPPFASHYFTACNTAARSLRALEEHLRARGTAEPSMVAVLQGQARRLEP
jgi:hypothetical protein